MGNHFGRKGSESFTLRDIIVYKRKPSAQIQRCDHQDLIHWHDTRPVAFNTQLFAHCFPDCRPECNTYIFHQMVIIYLEIACGVGVFGLLAYLSMYYAAIRQFLAGMSERWRGQEDWVRHLSYYLMISLISCMISGIFANIEFDYFPWILAATGLVIANLRQEFRAG